MDKRAAGKKNRELLDSIGREPIVAALKEESAKRVASRFGVPESALDSWGRCNGIDIYANWKNKPKGDSEIMARAMEAVAAGAETQKQAAKAIGVCARYLSRAIRRSDSWCEWKQKTLEAKIRRIRAEAKKLAEAERGGRKG